MEYPNTIAHAAIKAIQGNEQRFADQWEHITGRPERKAVAGADYHIIDVVDSDAHTARMFLDPRKNGRFEINVWLNQAETESICITAERCNKSIEIRVNVPGRVVPQVVEVDVAEIR